MTIKAGHLWPAFIVMTLFGFILLDCQIGLLEKKSSHLRLEPV